MSIKIAQHEVLKGQRALVTGANSGIGAAVAQGLGAAGAKVVVNYLVGEDKAADVVALINDSGGEAIAIRADVSRENEVREMFAHMYDLYGGIEILVNNAGLQLDSDIVDMTIADWQFVLDVNLTGQFLCAREAARQFIRQGVRPDVSCAAGKIICMSSVHDAIPWVGHAHYAASKGGVRMFMRTLAQELARYRIRVNSISPGVIKTSISALAWSTPGAEAALLELIPYGRVGEVGDIARAAVYLASDTSDYITGTTLYVDGGMTLALPWL